MALALEARARADDILIGDTPKARRRRHRLRDLRTRGRLWKHSRLDEIDGLVGPQALGDFFIFTLVRNPWDRLVSYYHWLRAQRFDHPHVALAQRLAFSAFLNAPSVQAAFMRNDAARYVTDTCGVERASAFVRLEHLARDLAPVNAHLGFDLQLPQGVNASDRERDFRHYYSDEDAGLVARICAADIARFGYSGGF